jgi:hypothetical protein
MGAVLKRPKTSGEALDEFERDARTLEKEKLSEDARAAWERLRAQISGMQEAIKRLQAIKPFSPQKAAERIVAELQNAEGGALSGADLKSRWGLTAAVLHRRRKEHRIIYWRDSRHDFFYPQWQFTETGALLAGIQEVLKIFDSDDEWRVMRHFLGARKQLGERRPLDLLRDGEIDTVIAHARNHGAENTW